MTKISCVAIACDHFDGLSFSQDDALCPECRAHEDKVLAMCVENTTYNYAIAALYAAVLNGYRNDPYYQSDNDPMMNVLAAREDYQQVGLSQVFHEIAYDLMRYKADNFADDDSAYEKLRSFIADTFAELIVFDVNESL